MSEEFDNTQVSLEASRVSHFFLSASRAFKIFIILAVFISPILTLYVDGELVTTDQWVKTIYNWVYIALFPTLFFTVLSQIDFDKGLILTDDSLIYYNNSFGFSEKRYNLDRDKINDIQIYKGWYDNSKHSYSISLDVGDREYNFKGFEDDVYDLKKSIIDSL